MHSNSHGDYIQVLLFSCWDRPFNYFFKIRINKNSNIKLKRYTLYQHELFFDEKNYESELPKIEKNIQRFQLFQKPFPNIKYIFKKKRNKLKINMKKKVFS